MAHRPSEHDLLAWIEGEELSPEAAAQVEKAIAADASLRVWVEAARADRDRLRALAEIEAVRAPRGMVDAAMEIAERDALFGGSVAAMESHAKRIRITPVRFVAAAGLVIAASAASLVGFFMLDDPMDQHETFALAEPESLMAPELADAQSDSMLMDLGGGTDNSAMATLAEAPPAEIAAGRQSLAAKAMSSEGFSREPSGGAASLRFRLIHPAEHAPEFALTPDRAAELAAEGRMLLLVRATNPSAVENALLAQDDTDDATAARWRRLVDVNDDLGGDAARLVVADALTTPGAMTRLIAAVTAVGGGVQGAWLQELADETSLEAAFVADDLMWWELPPTAWAPRAAVPVLIERVDPVAPDAESNDPAQP